MGILNTRTIQGVRDVTKLLIVEIIIMQEEQKQDVRVISTNYMCPTDPAEASQCDSCQ